MSRHFCPWTIDQTQLLPAAIADYAPADHLAQFVVALAREHLDLSEIVASYKSGLGQPPFDPRMMTALLLYAYCSGLYSSRRIAKACAERGDFMMIVAHDAPDFRTIADFRKRHPPTLGRPFLQVLKLAEKAGLAKLGHVALDDTKIKVNASKHKQIIVAHGLTQSMSDCPQLVPLVDAVRANLGRKPREISADAGYCSEDNLFALATRKIHAYVATGRAKHPAETTRKVGGEMTQSMRQKLKRAGYRSRHRLRKQIVEPAVQTLSGRPPSWPKWARVWPCSPHLKRKFCAPTSSWGRRPDPRRRSRPSRSDSTTPYRHWCCATKSQIGRCR